MKGMKASKVLWESVTREGVKFVFGVPGPGVEELTDALLDTPELRWVRFRHEEGAAFAAGSCSRVLGYRPVAVLASAGSGAMRCLNGMGGAYYDCWPVVMITGVPDYSARESDAFLSLSKMHVRITDPNAVASAVHQALTSAISFPPGPVYIEIPTDVQSKEGKMMAFSPSKVVRPVGDPNDIAKAVEILLKAEKPLILAGGAAIISGASEEVQELAELLVAPVITTITGRYTLSDDHPLACGLGGFPMGMLGSKLAIKLAQDADVLIALGVRFTELTTSQWSDPGKTKIIQINIDPVELGRNYPVAIGILGDVKLSLQAINNALREKLKRDYTKSPRFKELMSLKSEHEKSLSRQLDAEDVPIHPARLINEIRKAFDRSAIATGEAGHVGNFAAAFYKGYHTNAFIRMGWFSSMAFAIPSALGAKIAAPDRQVVAICGDGGFVMNLQELETARRENLGIVAVIFNNSILAAIKVTQLTAFKRYYGSEFQNPDFVKLAEAFGCFGTRVERPNEIAPALKEAIKVADEGIPAVVDVLVGVQAPPRTGRWLYPGFHDDSIASGYLYTYRKGMVPPPLPPPT